MRFLLLKEEKKYFKSINVFYVFLKKLVQIDDLRQRQKAGEKMEKNQLDKIKTESELTEELEKLEI